MWHVGLILQEPTTTPFSQPPRLSRAVLANVNIQEEVGPFLEMPEMK